jgi:hypothetical protein
VPVEVYGGEIYGPMVEKFTVLGGEIYGNGGEIYGRINRLVWRC